MTERELSAMAATARRRLRSWTPGELALLRLRATEAAHRGRSTAGALGAAAALVSVGALAAIFIVGRGSSLVGRGPSPRPLPGALAVKPVAPEWHPAAPPSPPLPAVERLDLGPGSFATPRTPDSRIEIREHTEHRVVVSVHAGAARFKVRHDPARQMIVEVGGVVVEDLGTTFVVEKTDGGAHVAVTEGRVAVHWSGRVSELGPGEEGTYPPAGAVTDAPSRAHAAALRTGGRAAGAKSSDELGQADKLLAAADAARASGDAGRATMLLRQFVQRHGGDPRSAAAAFTLARLLEEKLGRLDEAARVYEVVERLAPHGALADKAARRLRDLERRAGER